ncbi:MAG TPA: hypothetical protein VNO52_11580 [Methylomirabilota bacterium]|nr:hypothetical protein [Methylomirabilota bacterium]
MWGWGGTSQAIDPLPPDIEAAPEPVKLAYIERTARASEREKIEVGRRRYERRMERKRAMVAEIRQQAADRRQEIQSQVRDLAMLAENSAPAASSRVNPFMIFLVVTAAVLAIWYRYVFKPRETSC